MVQTFTVFADGPTPAKIKTTNGWDNDVTSGRAASCVRACHGCLYGRGFPWSLV